MEMPMRLALLLALSCLTALPAAAASAPHATLKPFASEQEFGALLERWRSQSQRLRRSAAESAPTTAGNNSEADMMAAPAAAPPAKAAAESITNVQSAGVDEGGIVKRAGDHLVILRRGRLFTVRVGGDELQPRSSIDAFAPGSDPQGAWYDELLIHDSTVVVIGYSYARGGTEIGLFELGRDGTLAYRATHHLRSHDYYSSRNYASRLIGSRLLFYTPMHIHAGALQPEQFMPQWRRWHAGTPEAWQRILPATRIYRSDDDIDPAAGGAALHTVTACDLAQPAQMRCEARAVLGPPGRVFYVSAASVYVWTTEMARRSTWGRPSADAMSRSAVYRLPLDGAEPSILKTTGAPLDQLSFLEDEGGHLNVLLRAASRGDGMWSAEQGRGDLALLRVPLSDFGDGGPRSVAPRSAYRPLPALPGHGLHNRFVGDWLIVGTPAAGAGDSAIALRYAATAPAQPLAPGHGVQRIEALGSDAVLVGNAGRDLHFTSLRLAGERAQLVDSHVQRDAVQGETRTHGFFYRATSADDGLIGLPVIGSATRRGGAHTARGDAASVLFLRQRALGLRAVGQLQSAPAAGGRDDRCRASCVDWYGNARPIFLGDRIFALLGYELVEGRLAGSLWRGGPGERIDERRRVDFAPTSSGPWGRD
jgi:hypothetical protein